MKNENNESRTKVAKGIGIGALICIVLAIIVSVAGLCVLFFSFLSFTNNTKNRVDKVFDMINDEYEDFSDEFKNSKKEQYAESFNSDIEEYNGTKNGVDVKTFLDVVVLKNKKNANHSISVVFNEETITDNSKIIELKMNIEDSANYEVILDYDTNYYVNKVTIKKY